MNTKNFRICIHFDLNEEKGGAKINYSQVLLNKPLLECIAYLYSIEINIKKYLIPEPQKETIDLLTSLGFIELYKTEFKIIDKEFGYACYEYYRQIHTYSELDQLLIEEAKGAKTILDLCCGPGATVYSLVQCHNPDHIYALDMNQKYLSFIKNVFENQLSLKTNIEVLLGDAYHIPLEDNSLDYVICRVALQYLNVKAALKEINRVLKRNGKVFFIVHGTGYPLNFLFTRRRISSLFSSVTHIKKNKQLTAKAKFLTTYRLKKNMINTNFTEIKTFKKHSENEFIFFPVYFAMCGFKKF